MLRIAVISLLVANLLLLGFQASKPAVQPETIAQKTVVENSSVPTIHLFSEMLQDQDLMSGNRRCFSLGPFHSSEDKYEIQALLENVSASISERETLALVEKGYWVYMPPYESLLEANQALLSLQALGLKDIGVIYNGDWQNAISLGYFLRQENALSRKKDLEDRNFTPMIRVQRQSETRYWLDYEQNPGSELIAIDMQNRPNDFMRRSLPCPEQDPFEITAPVSESLVAEESIDTASTDNAEAAEPEPTIETEPETLESFVDDTLQQQVVIPEESDGSQTADDNVIDPEKNMESTPIDGDKTEPESAIETEAENSVGTGPVIGFGTAPEEGDETETEGSNQTEPDGG